MTDPQQIVNDALADTPTSSTMPTLPPTPEAPITPQPVEPVAPPTLPVEPVAPVVTTTTTTTTPPTEEVPVAPVTPAPTLDEAAPVATPTVTTTTTTNVPPGVPMGDETPLAFVTPPPSVTPPPTTTTTTTTMAEPAYIPPVQDVPKPKKGGSKILMTLLGIFALLATLSVGGFYAYQQFGGEASLVAPISQAECGKCNATGYVTRWDNASNSCRATNTRCVGGDNGVGGTVPVATPNPVNGNCGTGFAYCAGCGGFCLSNTSTDGCNIAQQQKCGEVATYGASYKVAVNGVCPGGFQSAKCTCGSSTVCFDRGFDTQCGGDQGLCKVYTNSEAQKFKLPGPDGIFGTADDEVAASQPTAIWYCADSTRKNVAVGASCDGTTGGSKVDAIPSCFCGVIQVDIPGQGYKSYQGHCGCAGGGASSPPGSTASTIACNSLTKNVADAAITLNSAVTLTCAGTVTPASAGTVSYQFRYMVGTGAWQTLAATNNTASLTPTQCGVKYTAQCRACATLDGVKQCDPVWQGVAP